MHTLNLRSFLWFITGVALTITSVGTFGAWRVNAGGPPVGESTFVPITPCRLFDTRAGENNVGTRDTPIAQTNVTFQVTGTNGKCIIPTDATAVAMNVTAANPTANSFLQAFPANVAKPSFGSNLNFRAGQTPVPNKVDVKLGIAGDIKFFNNAGTVDVIGDVVGYYTSSTVTQLSTSVANLQVAVAQLTADDATQDAAIAKNADDILDTQMDVEAIAIPPVIHVGVDVNGTMFRPVGVLAVSRESTGRYEVTLNQDINGCSPVVTGFDVNLTTSVDVFIAGQPTFNVEMRNLSGDLTNGGFFFAAICTP